MGLQQLIFGRDHLFNLLVSPRLLVLPKRKYHKITCSYHYFHCHTYLSLVTNAYSRKTVEYHTQCSMTDGYDCYQNTLV